MRQEDLPERWKIKLQEYLVVKRSIGQHKLDAPNFPLEGVVRIQFEDDSIVEFKYAFAIEAPEFREVAIFTEHCGYHVFPLYEGIRLTVEANS